MCIKNKLHLAFIRPTLGVTHWTYLAPNHLVIAALHMIQTQTLCKTLAGLNQRVL